MRYVLLSAVFLSALFLGADIGYSSPIYTIETRSVTQNSTPVSDEWGTPTYAGTLGDKYLYTLTRIVDYSWTESNWAITQGPNTPPCDMPGCQWVIDGSNYTNMKNVLDWISYSYMAFTDVQNPPAARDAAWTVRGANFEMPWIYTEITTYYALVCVPEPATILLFSLGLFGLVCIRRKTNGVGLSFHRPM